MRLDLVIGHAARARGFVLVRNSHAYHLWSSKHGRYALRSATLIDVQAYLDGERVNAVKENIAKRKVEREPLRF